MAVFIASLAFVSLVQSAARELGYRIGPKDLVAIRVFEVPELNVEARVSEDGAINLPLVGDVAVSGLTADELTTRLESLLKSKYVQRASVSVQVREFRSRPISVIGAVRQPGPLAFSGRWTLLEAIAAAGGLDEKHGDVAYVLRRAPNGLNDQVEISLNDLMVRADPKVNIPIFANDLINIPTPVPITVFCLGEVEQAGALAFQSTERTTLLTAIARAGGLTDRASSDIVIKRRDPTGREIEIKANYKRIVSGKARDVELQANDVIVVKRSLL